MSRQSVPVVLLSLVGGILLLASRSDGRRVRVDPISAAADERGNVLIQVRLSYDGPGEVEVVGFSTLCACHETEGLPVTLRSGTSAESTIGFGSAAADNPVRFVVLTHPAERSLAVSIPSVAPLLTKAEP